MARDRANINWGVSKLSLTGTTGTSETSTGWLQMGPFLATRFHARAYFSTASTAGNKIKVQGAFAYSSTMISTKAIVTILSINSSQSTAAKTSTAAGWYNFVRLASTAFANTRTVTVHFSAGAA